MTGDFWHLAGGRLLECGDGAGWLVTVFFGVGWRV